jgi:hypothetical protein
LHGIMNSFSVKVGRLNYLQHADRTGWKAEKDEQIALLTLDSLPTSVFLVFSHDVAD